MNFRSFTDSDWSAFAGAQGDDPKIAECKAEGFGEYKIAIVIFDDEGIGVFLTESEDWMLETTYFHEGYDETLFQIFKELEVLTPAYLDGFMEI